MAEHPLILNTKKNIFSLRIVVLYNIFVEFGITMRVGRLFKVCLSEDYITSPEDKHLSVTFPKWF